MGILDYVKKGAKYGLGGAAGMLAGVGGGLGMLGATEAGKDTLRNVPILGGALGLTSPEEMAEGRLQAGLTAAGQQARQGYGQAQELYGPLAGLAQSLPGLQQQLASGAYSGPQLGVQGANLGVQGVNLGVQDADRGPQLGMEQFNFDFQQDPGQQFAMDQGIDATQAMLAARGLTGSGREQKEIAQFATGLAGQQYGQNRRQAFNEFQNRQQNRLGFGQFQQAQGQQEFQNRLSQSGLAQQEFQNRLSQSGLRQQEFQNRLSQSGLAQQQHQNRLGALDRQIQLGGTGANAIGAQAGLHQGLAQTLADLELGRGQAGASRIMGEAAQTRGLLTEGMKILPKLLTGGAG